MAFPAISLLPTPDPGPDDLRPLPDLVGRIALEIGELAGLADGLQGLIGRGGNGADPTFLSTAQSLDLLVQRLAGIRTFLDELGPALPAEWRVDAAGAAEPVTLQRLKDRLSFADARADDDNDFELF